jgi:hypothetical protein
MLKDRLCLSGASDFFGAPRALSTPPPIFIPMRRTSFPNVLLIVPDNVVMAQ